MYEIEVKVPADLPQVRDRLTSIGVSTAEEVTQVDTYFDPPHRSFAETDEALRVRRERRSGDVHVRVTYKGPLLEAESKSRAEFETTVGDGDTLETIFERLGFDAVETVRKTRTRYRVDGYTVSLDEVAGAGTFVEVEREVDLEESESAETAGDAGSDEGGPEERISREVASVREGAFDVLRRIDLDPDDQIRTSYLELILQSNER